MKRLLALAAVTLALTACAATQATDAVAPTAPGFLLGLWHGFIFPVAWVVSLFGRKSRFTPCPTTAAGTTSAISSASSCSASALGRARSSITPRPT